MQTPFRLFLNSNSADFSADLLYGISDKLDNVLNFLQVNQTQHAFLVDTVTKERLVFQYNVSLSESGGANYATHEVLARSIPKFHYRGGKERVLELPLTFTVTERSREDLQKAVSFLQSLAYPDYNANGELQANPHPVVVVYGKLYSKDVWLVRDFQISWGDVLDPISQMPNEVSINLSLVEIRGRAKGFNEIIRL